MTAGNPLLRLGFYNPAHASSRPRVRAVAGRLRPSLAQAIRVASVARSPSAQGLLCRSAVAAAERGSGIPAHLLAAISRVESGRRDPVTGAVHPWPWTVNAEGQGFFYDTKAEAVAAVRAMQARGVRSIDVGCVQINLMHHPDAFPSLELAFDPQANAAYAAQFLKELYAQTGDWNKAAAMYHSATPGTRRRVPATGAGGLAGGAAGRRPCRERRRWPRPGPPRSPRPARLFARAAHTAAGDGSRAADHHAATAGGVAPPARLDAYRAAPIGLAYQPPPSRRAGG